MERLGYGRADSLGGAVLGKAWKSGFVMLVPGTTQRWDFGVKCGVKCEEQDLQNEGRVLWKRASLA